MGTKKGTQNWNQKSSRIWKKRGAKCGNLCRYLALQFRRRNFLANGHAAEPASPTAPVAEHSLGQTVRARTPNPTKPSTLKRAYS